MSERQGMGGGGGGGRSAASVPPAETLRRAKPGGGGGGSGLDPDAWMVTFSDLLTLLMTFFVLIFASQDPVPPKQLQEAFGPTQGVFGLFRKSFLEDIFVAAKRDVSEDLIQVFLNEIGSVDIEVSQQIEGLVVTLPADTFFQPGRAELNERSRQRLDKLAEFLSVTRHRIRVEGHADNRERALPPYPSVWELSVARAHRVLQRLLAHGLSEERMMLAGYGPTRPRFDNVSRVGQARNRRVDIVILNRRPAAP